MDIILERDFKTIAWLEQDGQIIISGKLTDDMHHIEVTLVFDYELEKVNAVRAVEWVRSPYPNCSDVREVTNRIIGLEVKTGATAFINTQLGESDGCVHLAEVVVQIFKCFFQVKHRIEDRKLPSEEERKKRKFRLLKDSCYVYTEKFFTS